MIVKLTQWRLDVRCVSILKLRDLNPCYRRERSRRVVAGNVSLSKRNRDSSLQEETRIKQGFEELAASFVVEQEPGSIYRTTNFNQLFEEEKQRLEKPSPPKQS